MVGIGLKKWKFFCSILGEKEETSERHLSPEVVKRACLRGRFDGPRLTMTNCLMVNYRKRTSQIVSSIDLISIAKVL